MRNAPIIVSALFGDNDFAWLDGLRREHFPPERNRLAAHLTLFHHLPPSAEGEVRRRLADIAARPSPAAVADGLINLGRGVAVRINSPELAGHRAELAGAFAGLLTPQDASHWRPHVTIQNKVTPADARSLLDALGVDFVPRPVKLAGLASWWYVEGDWKPLSRHMFS